MHCYKLCFTVQPGGSRKTEYYVFGTLDEVKAAARDDLNSPQGAYHALLYGESILLQCWEDGRKVASIDLHPYITYVVRDRVRLTMPWLLPEDDDETRQTRGTEKRRHLLSYLREHPEELHPINGMG